MPMELLTSADVGRVLGVTRQQARRLADEIRSHASTPSCQPTWPVAPD